MLARAHVAPFLRVERGVAQLSYLADPDGKVVPFLDRVCLLLTRLEGSTRDTVVEALRRQERRVRDASRLAGIAKALLDACEFAPPEGAELATEIREALFRARGMRWPPVPGDERIPYELAAARLGRSVSEVRELLYADRPGSRVLVRAARMDGRALLARYNLELARAVLLDAERVRITARGGWRSIFRALKLARLMHVVRRRIGSDRAGWHLSRETTPVVAGDELFLPDFTLRHADGREALIELVGFWTPEYLEAKARKIAASQLGNLILVVYRRLAVGASLGALTTAVGMDRVVWFTTKPRATEVLRVAERYATR